jgi:protein-S-isoprenylcysteine O-methyltransferase Ste14
MIDRVRYLLAVLSVIVLPSGLLFWLVIHPWARWWRTLGPIRTYVIVLPALIGLDVVLFPFRGSLIGADFGANALLIAIAAVLYGVVARLELQYWKHLSISTLIGVPELSRGEHGKAGLLQDGIYRIVRHPRYLSAGIGTIANALIVNYAGVYVLLLGLFPAGYVMMLLEERELVDRFGEPYRKYQRDVPRIIPARRAREK